MSHYFDRNRGLDRGDPGFTDVPKQEKKTPSSAKACPKGCGSMTNQGGIFSCTCGEQVIPDVREQPF